MRIQSIYIYLCSPGLLSCGRWVVIWRRLYRPWKTVQIKGVLLFIKQWDLMQTHFISYQWESQNIPRGQMSVFSRIRKCEADLEREITANNRVGHNCSVVYTAHGTGFGFGTPSIQWNPETRFPLCCVMWRLQLILFTLPSAMLPPTSGGRWELSSGCSMSGCPLKLQAATWAH